jgi:hypothetical protein
MSNDIGTSRGERWVLYISRQPSATFLPLIWIALAVLWFVTHFVFRTSSLLTQWRSFDWAITAVWLALALISFERHHFGAIIRKQQALISELSTNR